MHLTKEEWQPGQKIFERILEKDKSDPYSLLALGNIYYNAKFHNPDKVYLVASSEVLLTFYKEAKYLKLAYDFYWKVLTKNPSNVYAANGVAIVTAEKGDLPLAKEFFTQIREAADHMPDVRLNLAHIHLGQGQFMSAVQLVCDYFVCRLLTLQQYQNCLKNFYYSKDETVLLYLAKAYFEWNKLDECKQTLQKAIHVAPHNMALWFNLALTQKTHATSIIPDRQTEKQTTKQPTVLDLQLAIRELGKAMRTFEHLGKKATTDAAAAATPATRINYSTTKALGHAKSCQILLKEAMKQCETAQQKEEQQLRAREEHLRAIEASARRQEEERDKIEQEYKDRQRREEEEAREVYEKNLLVVQKFVSDTNNEEETPSRSKGRKKSKKSSQASESEPPDEDAAESWEDLRDKRVCVNNGTLYLLIHSTESQGERTCRKTKGTRGRGKGEKTSTPGYE